MTHHTEPGEQFVICLSVQVQFQFPLLLSASSIYSRSYFSSNIQTPDSNHPGVRCVIFFFLLSEMSYAPYTFALHGAGICWDMRWTRSRLSNGSQRVRATRDHIGVIRVGYYTASG
jgi:hypothetical protein